MLFAMLLPNVKHIFLKFTMMLQFVIQYVFRLSVSSTFYQRYKLKRQGMMYISLQHCKKPTVFEKVMQYSPETGATNTETCSSELVLNMCI